MDNATAQKQIEAALAHLAGRCDRATMRDGQGFSAAHATRARGWAALLRRRGSLPVPLLAEVLEVLRVYERTQLQPAGLPLPAEAPQPEPVVLADLHAEVRRVVFKGEWQCLVVCLPDGEVPPAALKPGDRFFKAWLPLAQLADNPTGKVLRLQGLWEPDPREPGRLLLRVETLTAPMSTVETLRQEMEACRTEDALKTVGAKVRCTPELTEHQRQDLRGVYVRVQRRIRESTFRRAPLPPLFGVGKVGLGNYDD